MIAFQRLRPEQKQYYDRYLMNCGQRGCEYSFDNLYLWGRQTAAEVDGYLVLFSHYEGRSIYLYPVGQGDIQPVLEAIMEDSRERGIPCRLTSLIPSDAQLLETLYPGQFRCCWNRGNFDYVYSIDDLADLKGRRFIKKRNHLNQFEHTYPDWRVEPLDEHNFTTARNFIDNWYWKKEKAGSDQDFHMEKVAMERAFRSYRALELEGILVYVQGRPAAVAMGSRLTNDTFDVHFEKADDAVNGAYGAVNREFARYIRGKFPEIRFFNREDDLGIPGLRTAKESYRPVTMIEKCWVYLGEKEYDD